MLRLRISHVSLNTKLFLLVIVSTLIPLFLFLFVLNQVLFTNSTENGLKSMSGATDIVHTTITNQTESIRKNTLLLLRDSNVRKLIQETSYNGDYTAQQELKSQANNIIDIIEETDYITSVIIYVNDSYTYVIDRKHYQPISAVSGSRWYQRLSAVPEKSMWISGDDFQGDNTSTLPSAGQRSLSTLAYVTKIVNLSNYHRYEAVIRIDYSMDLLQALLTNGLVLPQSSSFLLDQDGNVLLSAGQEGAARPEPSLFSESGSGEDGLQECVAGGERYWKYQCRIGGLDWRLAAVAPVSSFDVLSAYRAYTPIMIVMAVSWLLVFVLCLLFSHGITSRIRLISESMRAMRERNELIPLPPSRTQDEITELADSYNHMAQELQENMQREYLLGISKRSSDLHALQAQINPHFLYNTLELIDYYAYEGQPERVEEIVSKLAKFYKLSLNHGQEIYQLWQEIQLVKSYFDIQNIRYQGKISLQIDVPTEFDQCQIPPIILQPLVENAINHGIRQRADKSGTISITAHSEGRRLILAVADDGIGIPPGLLDEINRGVQQPAGYLETGSHYGIRNIDQRLKIMFGESYGLHLSSGPGRGATVVIVIPL